MVSHLYVISPLFESEHCVPASCEKARLETLTATDIEDGLRCPHGSR